MTEKNQPYMKDDLVLDTDTTGRREVQGGTEFEGLDESELEAIVETALNIPPERAATIRSEHPE